MTVLDFLAINYDCECVFEIDFQIIINIKRTKLFYLIKKKVNIKIYFEKAFSDSTHYSIITTKVTRHLHLYKSSNLSRKCSLYKLLYLSCIL